MFTCLDSCINTNYSFNSIKYRLAGHHNKIVKESGDSFVPILFGQVTKKSPYNEEPSKRTVKILLDSGASESIAHITLFDKDKIRKNTSATNWNTMAGNFSTNARGTLKLRLPELNPSAELKVVCHVTNRQSNYKIILGRDVLSELGIVLDFKRRVISWNESEAQMKPFESTSKTHFSISDSTRVSSETERIKRILDAKYEKANLSQIVREAIHLETSEQDKLYKVLKKYEILFDGTLGKWEGKPYHIDLRDNVTPFHAKPFSIPKMYEHTLKMEVERLVKLGVLRKINNSEWAAPTFIIPKKDGSVRFISDFRELNKRIKRKPYPIPKIQDLLLKLEGFKYATSLDLNMGYYHIELDTISRKLCTIVLPWGKYQYQKLPMGLCNSPDIFQEKMNELFVGLDNVRAYIDDLLILSTKSFDKHLEDLDKVFYRLKQAGLKVNAKKSFFAKSELKYLGFWITRQGIMPLPKKVQAIKTFSCTKNQKATA